MIGWNSLFYLISSSFFAFKIFFPLLIFGHFHSMNVLPFFFCQFNEFLPWENFIFFAPPHFFLDLFGISQIHSSIIFNFDWILPCKYLHNCMYTYSSLSFFCSEIFFSLTRRHFNLSYSYFH